MHVCNIEQVRDSIVNPGANPINLNSLMARYVIKEHVYNQTSIEVTHHQRI